MKITDQGGHGIVGGYNYGQGSSREHAALAPRYLGLKVSLVKDFVRIHWQNLVNFGIIPLTFRDVTDYDVLEEEDVLVLKNIRSHIKKTEPFFIEVKGKNKKIEVEHALSKRQMEIMQVGGLINWVKLGKGSVKHG